MFGYHDSNRCAYDLWSPVRTNSYSENADSIQKGYGVWEDTPYHTAIENRAFSPYAQHTQDVEDIINLIGQGYTAIEPETNLSSSDLRHIESEPRRRYGMDVSLS